MWIFVKKFSTIGATRSYLRRLGHADVSTTARYYLQPAGELDARASMAFDAAFAVARPSSDEGNVSEIMVRKEA